MLGRASEGLDTPWKTLNEVRRIGFSPLFRLYFTLHGIQWKSNWRVFGLPLIQRHRGSKISIGDSFQMRNWLGSNPLGINHRSVLATWSSAATITIGDDVAVSGTTIVAESQVSIGDHVTIGANSTIVDTDFHPLRAEERAVDPKRGKTAEVCIEDHVFIGMNVLILKGSHIGSGAVIGAGSVISGQVPESVIVAGNPAKIIRRIHAD